MNMNVYKFEIGMYNRQCICVLANNENEACEIISKYRNTKTDKKFITKIYNSPQIVSVIRDF